jgi:hypothetical protein
MVDLILIKFETTIISPAFKITTCSTRVVQSVVQVMRLHFPRLLNAFDRNIAPGTLPDKLSARTYQLKLLPTFFRRPERHGHSYAPQWRKTAHRFRLQRR